MSIESLKEYDESWVSTHMDPEVFRVNNLSGGFEKAVKKLQAKTPLLEEDKPFVKLLKKKKTAGSQVIQESSSSSEEEEEEDEVLLSPRSAKKQRRMEVHKRIQGALKSDDDTPNQDYINADFVIGTNDDVERFFSICKHVLTDQRGSLTPLMFECIVFLKINNNLWGASDVALASKKDNSDKEEKDYQLHKAAIEEDGN